MQPSYQIVGNKTEKGYKTENQQTAKFGVIPLQKAFIHSSL
jgi:hypothetical protein